MNDKNSLFFGLGWSWVQLALLALIIVNAPFTLIGCLAFLAVCVNAWVDIKSMAMFQGANVKRYIVLRMLSITLNVLGGIAAALGTVVALVYGHNTVVNICAFVIGFVLFTGFVVDQLQYGTRDWLFLNWTFAIGALTIVMAVTVSAFHWVALLVLGMLTIDGIYMLASIGKHLFKVFTTRTDAEPVKFAGWLTLWKVASFLLGLVAAIVTVIGAVVSAILGFNAFVAVTMAIVCVMLLGNIALHLAIFRLR